jgi:3-deoxy-D-manno-octulosonic-acid transferase
LYLNTLRVMQFFYSLIIYLYGIIAKIMAVKFSKIKLFVLGRKQWRCQLQSFKNNQLKGKEVVWMHCASLGEFEQGRPVVEKLKAQQPNIKILLTFYSPSGYEVRKNYKGADAIMYLPLDTIANAKDFVSILKPSLALFVKYEFWYNYIHYLYKSHVPIVFFSVIFQPRHIYFKWYGGFFRRMLQKIDFIYVQNKESKSLLEKIGVYNCEIAGDTRFDRAIEVANLPFYDVKIDDFVQNRKVMVAGSTWYDDELLLKGVLEKLPVEWVLVLAPHEIDNNHIEKIEKLFQDFQPLRYVSDVSDTSVLNSRVLIVNTIGKLAYLYRFADAVWIGGGFNKSGIHNTVEAAVYGKPILIGPNYQKFQEAIDMECEKALVSFKGAEEEAKIVKLITNEKALAQMGTNASLYTVRQRGASSTIVDYLVLKYFSNKP